MDVDSVAIEIIHEENQAVLDELVSGVRQYNIDHMGDEKTKPLSVVARDHVGKLIGGVSGVTIYQHFLISVVWVDEVHRGTGLGAQLMMQAESEAKQRDCLVAQLDTLSFQAPTFYQKMGFEIVGTVPAFSNSPGRFFMMKRYDEVNG
ncbi:GNAT family N-acetyltransferase [Shewanella surugensis]|uniref:GNAT family N-acetyltransferase n=1 Tax=Shewanella surugensis TaxID=212020 RepID=A0ABT0LBL1_9GAMM|nr:GNAT family N-acetyltransferase [Shewanella surugensis]MCL1124737.1 GNAT family N-acetyltransferase [Shewanella surugensis]